MKDYPVDNGFSDVDFCFMITATPINTGEGEKSKEDVLTLLMKGEDISSIINSTNISPFRTILFPNTKAICDAFLDLLDKNEEREEKGEKPIYPVINLNRFELETPEPYFRRYTKDGEGVNEGDWILAEKGDETLDNDPMNRKVFRTIWVTSVCKTVDGEDVPTENITRKAARAYTNGLTAQAGSGYMITPCKQQLLNEEKLAEKNKPKQTDQQGGDDLLVSEFEKSTTTTRRNRRN